MDAFGYNALSGFYGSSQRKSIRQQQIAYLQQIYQMQQQEELKEMQIQNAYVDAQNQFFQQAVNLTTGENARPRDREIFQNISSDLLAPINEKIRRAGGYRNAQRLGIDEDLRNYRRDLLNNDSVEQLNKNRRNLAKIMEVLASNTPELLNYRDRESYRNFINGKTDVVEWRGTTDGVLNFKFLETPEYTNEREISIDDYIQHNQNVLAADFAYFMGGNNVEEQERYHSLALNSPGNPGYRQYVTRRLTADKNYDPNIKFGKTKIKTSLGQELLNGLVTHLPKDGFTQKEVIQSGSLLKLLDRSDKGGKDLTTFFHNQFTLDETNTNLYSKSGIVGDFAGQLFAEDKEMENRVLQAYYGNDLRDPDYDERLNIKSNRVDAKGAKILTMTPSRVNSLFDLNGSKLEGQTTYMDRTASDMRVVGVFLGLKGVYFDKDTGERKEKILTKEVRDLDPTRRAAKINEIFADVADKESVRFKPAYIIQLEEPDAFGFGRYSTSDIYYDELDLSKQSFIANIKDEAYDQALSEGRNMRAQTYAREQNNQIRTKFKDRVNGAVNDIYFKGDDIARKSILNAYEPAALSVMKVNGIERQMMPYFMADMIDEAQAMPGELTQNLNAVMQNFYTLAQPTKPDGSKNEAYNPELFKAYQSGNPEAVLNYYTGYYANKKNGEKIIKLKMERFKLWSKYFN